MALLDDDTTAQNYGALFGGAGQSFVSPFMGQNGQQAAMDNSLLNMGAAMMQASGRSFDPSHSSFLSSLGAGIGAGQTAYQNSVSRGLQAANAAQQLRANQLAYAQNLMFLRAAAAMNPEGPAAASPESSGAAQAAVPGGGTLPGLPSGLTGPMAGIPQPAAAASSTPMPNGNGAGGGVVSGTNGQPAGSGAGGPVSGAANPLAMPGMDPRTAALELLGNRQGYLTALANSYSPTDLMKTLSANGVKPGSDEWNAAMTAESQKLTAPQATRLTNGAYLLNGQYHGAPNAEGIVYEPDGQGGYSASLVPGAAAAQTTVSTAKAAGPATFKTVQTMGPNGVTYATPQTTNAQAAGAYVPPSAAGVSTPTSRMPMSPQAAIRQIESGGAPASAAIVNPASGARGSMQDLPSTGRNPGFGVKPSNGTPEDDTRLGNDYYAAMQNRYHDPAAAALAYTWGPGNVDNWLATGADPSKVPADKIAYVNKFLGLTGGAQGAPAPQTGGAPQVGPANQPPGLPTSLPVGIPQRQQQAQGAASASMEKDYNGMQSFRQAAPAQLQALQTMRQIALGKTILSTGPLGDTEVAQDNPFNPSPAEYEKQRSNYLTVAGATGTDAQRAQAAHSLPDYGKPKQAIIQGIDTQIGQTQQGLLRAQFLTPAYNAGDATKYTQAANDFDQHVTPKMASVLSMPPGPQQKAAYRALVQANPALKANFQWALDNGMLK